MVKSFITLYLIQCHKNGFPDELFLSVYSILQMELYFPGLVKYHIQILESVANKERFVPRKKSNS